MKIRGIFSIISLNVVLLTACGNGNSAKSTTDTGDGKAKADTAIVAGDQKNVKNDSVSGDPSSKGTSDPNAKLPKK